MADDPVRLADIGGMILGSLLLLAVAVVYLKKTKIDVGGVALAALGVILFGLSIWKNFEIDFRKGHLSAETREVSSRERTVSPNLAPSIADLLQYKIAVVNQSKSVDDSQIGPVIDALTKQIGRDFAPIWGIGAQLSFAKDGQVPAGAWTIILVDDAGKGMISYHELGQNDLPQARIGAATASKNGLSWSVSLSHEIINMLADPRANLTVVVANENGVGRAYAFEPANPCLGEANGYTIDAVKVSDFVYPSWFNPSAKAGPFDKVGNVKQPLDLCPGAFLGAYEFTGGKWGLVQR